MRSRLLVSAAILVAGVAIASAQNAPGGAGHERIQGRGQVRDHLRNAARDHGASRTSHGQNHRAHGAVAGKGGQPQWNRAVVESKGSAPDNLHKPLRHAAAKRHEMMSHVETALRPRTARGDLLTPARHNGTPLSAPHSPRERSDRERRDGIASDRWRWDRATTQGRAQSEPGNRRMSQSVGRPVRGKPASAMRAGRGHQDHARSQALRRLPDRGTGRAGERELHALAKSDQAKGGQAKSARGHSATLRQPRRDSVSHAGQAEVRKAQAALNQQGFNAGSPDGKLGRRTKEALIAFQKQHGVQTTGKVDRATLHALSSGGAIQESSKNASDKVSSSKESKKDSSKGGSENVGGQSQGQTPAPAPPQNVPAEATMTGQGATPAPAGTSPQPTAEETPAGGDGLHTPDASSRVPAGSPQEDYNDDEGPTGGDQR